MVSATLKGTSIDLTVGLSNATGTVAYQWQSSTGASGSFSNITNATLATFDYSTINATTYIRPVVTDTTSGGGTTTYLDIAVIKVYKVSTNTRIDITFGSQVTSIGDGAFAGCTSLATLTIGDSVISIGSLAFYACTSLATLTIGDSVTSIGTQAFMFCSSLANIYFLGAKPNINSTSFESNTNDTAYYRATYTTWGDKPTDITNLQHIPTIRAVSATTFTGSCDATLATVFVYISSDDGLTWTTYTAPASNGEWSLSYSFATGATYKVSTIANYYNESMNAVDAIYCKTLDLQSPIVTITSDKTSLKIGETATLTITFSETVTDFVIGDLSTTNGTITSLSANVNVYTAIFTPSANFEGTATISIADGRFSDAAGNYNVDGSDANNTVSIAVDTIAPGNPSVTGTASGTISGTAEANSTLLATKTNNATESVSVDSTGQWRLNVASIDSYVFRARDTAGNVSNPTTFLSSSFSFRYPGSSSPFRFPVGAPIKSIGMLSGGRISGDSSTSFKIKPALPAGLSFSKRTGKITGTPLELLAATEYTITSQSTVYLPRKAKITIEVL